MLSKLHILVNNAGVGFPFGAVEEQSLEDWRSVMAVNSDGVFLGVKQGIRAMRRSGDSGSIINVSSIAGIAGVTMNCAYTASKGAVRLLTKTAAIYCARQGLPVRVNSIHPGFIATDMARDTMRQNHDPDSRMRQVETQTPMGRLGKPEEIASGILFLASDESSFMTGAELVIDGGYIAQ